MAAALVDEKTKNTIPKDSLEEENIASGPVAYPSKLRVPLWVAALPLLLTGDQESISENLSPPPSSVTDGEASHDSSFSETLDLAANKIIPDGAFLSLVSAFDNHPKSSIANTSNLIDLSDGFHQVKDGKIYLYIMQTEAPVTYDKILERLKVLVEEKPEISKAVVQAILLSPDLEVVSKLYEKFREKEWANPFAAFEGLSGFVYADFFAWENKLTLRQILAPPSGGTEMKVHTELTISTESGEKEVWRPQPIELDVPSEQEPLREMTEYNLDELPQGIYSIKTSIKATIGGKSIERVFHNYLWKGPNGLDEKHLIERDGEERQGWEIIKGIEDIRKAQEELDRDSASKASLDPGPIKKFIGQKLPVVLQPLFDGGKTLDLSQCEDPYAVVYFTQPITCAPCLAVKRTLGPTLDNIPAEALRIIRVCPDHNVNEARREWEEKDWKAFFIPPEIAKEVGLLGPPILLILKEGKLERMYWGHGALPGGLEYMYDIQGNKIPIKDVQAYILTLQTTK